jgi:hypothetical protein
MQSDSTLLSGFPWPINGNSDNNLESFLKPPVSVKMLVSSLASREINRFSRRTLVHFFRASSFLVYICSAP